jgi:MFS family permease
MGRKVTTDAPHVIPQFWARPGVFVSSTDLPHQAAASAPRAATLWALLLASSLTVMAGATIAPALPQIEATFAGTPHVELLTRLVLTVTAIFTVVGSPLAGLFVDRFGRKPLLMVGLVLYAVAGTSGLYVDSLDGLAGWARRPWFGRGLQYDGGDNPVCRSLQRVGAGQGAGAPVGVHGDRRRCLSAARGVVGRDRLAGAVWNLCGIALGFGTGLDVR